jgi:hypothetical protein
MLHHARWALIPALLLGWSSAAVQAYEVRDKAGLFSAAAKEKANADIAAIKSKFKKDVLIETHKDELPADFTAWATNEAASRRIDGLYIVVVTDGKKYKFQIVESESLRKPGFFTTENRNHLKDLIDKRFKAKQKDEGLTEATAYIRRTLEAQAPTVTPPDRKTRAQEPAPAPQHNEEPIPWVKYILIGIAVLIVLWLVIGVIRAISGAGRSAGPGYAGGGGGDWGGGGGDAGGGDAGGGGGDWGGGGDAGGGGDWGGGGGGGDWGGGGGGGDW